MSFNKNFLFIITSLSIINIHDNLIAKRYLAFDYNGGRLGDVLLDFTKNFYIAKKYNLELYLNAYLPYLEDFTLDFKIPYLTQKLVNTNEAIHITDAQTIDMQKDNVLYVSKNYVAVDNISNFDQFHSYMFQCSIEQPQFGNEIKQLLTPKTCFSLEPPKDHLSVAIHIRKGGGFDRPLASEQYRPKDLQHNKGTRTDYRVYADRDQPFKFPPEQYYVDQLIFLHTLLNQQPLYVFLFTDDKEPQHIVERIQEKLEQRGITNVIFDYRKSENAHNLNILEDISFMSKFDYLLKSGSHYPWIAQMIGNHKAIISPIEHRWDGDYLNIIHAEIVFPDRENHILRKIKIPSFTDN